MSLKAFHIFFVAVSMLLAVGFGIWCIVQSRAAGHVGHLLTGLASFVGGGMLLLYGRWFLGKLKGISYI